jgi:HAD superfamily hydrolase (TIGR01549 family)
MARPYAPAEVTHEQYWADFVCADWPGPARAAVVARATELAYALTSWGSAARLRDGVVDLLDAARAAGIPLAVVSNTLCGAAFRDFLDRAGVGDRFAVQCYSDEVGVRKPNPALVLAATDALGVAPADVWFVGDTPLRDVLAGRRAGVGRAILVRSGRRVDESDPRAQPDVVLQDMVDVHHFLLSAWGGS